MWRVDERTQMSQDQGHRAIAVIQGGCLGAQAPSAARAVREVSERSIMSSLLDSPNTGRLAVVHSWNVGFSFIVTSRRSSSQPAVSGSAT